MTTKRELLDVLEGTEVLSEKYEGCVGIFDGKIVQMGEVLDANPTKATLQALFNEEFAYEFGPNWEADLIAEFS